MSLSLTEVRLTIQNLLNGSDRIEIDISDPKYSDLVAVLRNAKVQLELTKGTPQIVLDWNVGGNSDILCIRVRKAGAPIPVAPVAPASPVPPLPPLRSPAPAPAPKQVPLSAPPSAASVNATSVVPKVDPKAQVKPSSQPKAKRYQHTYIPPKIAADFMRVIADEASHNIWLFGPTQCGKTRLVQYIGRETNRKVFQINGRGDMSSEHFFGEKTIVVDEATKQNVIVFKKGMVEMAMTEGLDENGNEVGSPAILFIDEMAAIPSHIAHGLNRVLESDDPRRTLILSEDGGRVVRSHSGFRIVLAANTAGRGATGLEASVYTAQADALDISLLHRISFTFRMGYDTEVERRILMEKIGDDKTVALILKFRDAIRREIKTGAMSSPFSTAHLVHIADGYRIFGDVAKAVFYSVFEMVLPEERAKYNEVANLTFGKDMSSFVQDGIDFMDAG